MCSQNAFYRASRYAMAFIFMAGSAALASAAPQITTKNPNTGLKSWKKSDRGFSLELIQLLPDFVQATYASRDLPPAIFESMKGYCIFGTVARNESDAPLSYRVADWRVVTADGRKQRLRSKDEWIKVWSKLGTDFSYSILPEAMDFDAGDWAQGFTTPRISPGTRFDLVYSWSQHGKVFTDTLKNLECPRPARAR